MPGQNNIERYNRVEVQAVNHPYFGYGAMGMLQNTVYGFAGAQATVVGYNVTAQAKNLYN